MTSYISKDQSNFDFSVHDPFKLEQTWWWKDHLDAVKDKHEAPESKPALEPSEAPADWKKPANQALKLKRLLVKALFMRNQ